MNDKKERKIFKLLPCYRNDILAIEAWLEDMAAEGYMLKKIFLSVAIFVETEPAHVRYRLLPEPINKLMDMGGQPTEQEHFIALREQKGWKHVTNMGQFFIFCTKNAALPEPERDLYEVASNRYHEAKKSLVMVLATTICSMATLGIVDALSLSHIVQFGTLIFLMIFWLFFYAVGVSICEVLRWRKVKKSLECEDSKYRDWREGESSYKTITMLVYIITTTLLIGSTGTYLYNVHPSNTIPMQQYEEPLPMPKLSEWYADTSFVVKNEDASIVNYNVIETRTDLLASTMLEYKEKGVIYQNNTVLFYGMVGVEYYEMISPMLAKPMAVSLYEDDRAFGEKYIKYQPLELPKLAVDYAIAYQILTRNTVVMAEENQVIRVYFYQDDGTEEMTVEKFAQIYAEYLLGDNSAAK